METPMTPSSKLAAFAYHCFDSMSTSISPSGGAESYGQGANRYGLFDGGIPVWYEQLRIPYWKLEEKRTVAMKKIAISLPQPVLRTVDQIAQHQRESRSHVIARILSRVARLKRDRDITAQIDALFSDGEIAAEQKRTADEFLRESSWPRERW